MEVDLCDLLSKLRKRGHLSDKKRLSQIYHFVNINHHGQLRQTGDPILSHLTFVACTLANWGLDQLCVEAALLHETIELTSISPEDLAKKFGEECASLVSSVTRVGRVKLRGSHEAEFLENLRKMFVAMAKDIRVVLICLADRLHDISTLEAIPLSKQKRISLETLEIYAPLADRLGMGILKGDLEDMAFPFAYPEEYQWLIQIARPHIKHSEANIIETIRRIKQQFVKHGLSVRTEFRLKRKYSLYNKLLRPEIGRDISLVHDLTAIRIITPDLPTCYSILGVIHQYWKPVPFLGISDFIAQPKPNGYRSIHTKVFDHRGNIIEVQIRTEDMHLQAEYGAAAHFAYSQAKQSGVSDKELERGTAFSISGKMAWIRQLADWQKQVEEESDSFSNFKLDALSHRIYVFSPVGDVFDLPENSTPVDFAFSVHSDLGFYLQSVKVNDKLVPVDAKLKSGDVIEILKSKRPKNPNKNWLRFVATNKARSEIKKRLSLM